VRQDERPIRYFAQDESRFGLKTLMGRLVTACGGKPIGQWQWLFKAFWLYGAVEPATGESFFLQFSHVDTQCYQAFLNEFSKAYPESLNILQVDNGRFHTSQDLVVPENGISPRKSLLDERDLLFQTLQLGRSPPHNSGERRR
jgi:hypothetical protein